MCKRRAIYLMMLCFLLAACGRGPALGGPNSTRTPTSSISETTIYSQASETSTVVSETSDTELSDETAETTLKESSPQAEAIVYGNISFYYEMTEEIYSNPNDGTELVFVQIQNISIDIDGNSTATELINNVLEKIESERAYEYELLCNDAQSAYDAGGMASIEAPFEYLAYTEPTYISNSFLSFYVLDYTFRGEANGGITVRGFSFDVSNGEAVTIESISSQPDAMMLFFAKHIVNQIIETPEEERLVYDGFEATIPEAIKDAVFIFTNAEEPSIIVVFQENTISPNSSSTPTFLIPIQECEEYLTDEAAMLFEPDEALE